MEQPGGTEPEGCPRLSERAHAALEWDTYDMARMHPELATRSSAAIPGLVAWAAAGWFQERSTPPTNLMSTTEPSGCVEIVLYGEFA